MIEGQRGQRADVEGGPVQDRLGGGLVDGDVGLTGCIDRLGRLIGAAPAGRRIRQQTAGAEAVRDGGRQGRGFLRGQRSGARGGLNPLQGLESLRGARQRTRRLLGDSGSLLRGLGRGVRRNGWRRNRRAAAAKARARMYRRRRCEQDRNGAGPRQQRLARQRVPRDALQRHLRRRGLGHVCSLARTAGIADGGRDHGSHPRDEIRLDY